jgi:CheY-like chemotaxis protein
VNGRGRSEVTEIGESARGTGPVLLVEDVPRNAEQFVRVLRMHGYREEVVVATDGVECLDYLFGEGAYEDRDTRLAPRLILLDVHMPRMDGLETLRRIREDERTSLLPVVMFSATSIPKDVVAAYELGANAFIDKVSAPVPFPEMVRILSRFWLGVNEPPPPSRSATFPVSSI